jgi:uncharacterized protein (TIGR02145 family)
MKKIILSIISIIIYCFYSFAQVPQVFNYQAVVRDNNGNELANQKVSFRISIIQGSTTGTTVYSETHIDSTNQFGLVILEIGNGMVVSGDFSTIDWGTNSYYLKAEMDESGEINYQEMGTAQLLSVPYAFYAAEAGEYTYYALQVSYDKISPTCYGKSDGSILVSITGGQPPYNIEWSTGDTISSLENIPAGDYVLTVMDSYGSVITRNISLYEPQNLQLTPTISNIRCYGEANGSIDLNVSGGSYPYIFEWSSGETTDQISGLSPGTYTCKVFDNNNCSDTIEVIIEEPDTLTVYSSITQNNCFNDDTASIDLTLSGGEPPYNFSWSNGQTTEDISNLENGNYTINIYDSRNCNISQTYEVTSKSSEITIDSKIQDVNCHGGSNGSVELTVTGGVSPYSYNWDNGATTKDISNLSIGYYTVIVTDLNSCKKVDSVLISEPDSITITIDKIIDEFKTTSDGSIDISVSGGTPPYSYNWSNAAITEDIDNLTSANYTVEVTDSKSCMKQKEILINRLDSITDIDGNKYDIVKIGEQVWTAENLKTTKYNDGWEIVNIMAPGNDEDSIPVYGRLYTWYVINGGEMCPEGWHVPTDSDWSTLVDSLRGPELAGGSLKESGTEHWFSPNTGATNQSGFTALPAGQGGSDVGYFAYFWSSTIYGNYTYYRRLSRTNTEVERSSGSKDYYLSVRCIKD